MEISEELDRIKKLEELLNTVPDGEEKSKLLNKISELKQKIQLYDKELTNAEILSEKNEYLIQLKRLDKLEEILANVSDSPEKQDKLAKIANLRRRIEINLEKIEKNLGKTEEKKEENIPIEEAKDSEQIKEENIPVEEVKDSEKIKEENVPVEDSEDISIEKENEIDIPELPEISKDDVPIASNDEIKSEFDSRLKDMYAKYYGDKDYEAEYKERFERFNNHEIEKQMKDSSGNLITYKTIDSSDYPEYEEDAKFLLLEEYKNSLERVTKYEAGVKDIYFGNEENIKEQYEADKEYVETKNNTFNQHKNTQKDLITMGKYGEKMPYIQKQKGLLKNSFRILANTYIFTRNLVSPIYRGIGKIVKPIHEMIFKKNPSPYKNNPYHRMVARRDYYLDKANQKDEKAEKKHPIKNYVSSRINALFNVKEGNEAVLRAGAKDIRNNLEKQYSVQREKELCRVRMKSFTEQLEKLEDELRKNPEAINKDEVEKRIEELKKSVDADKEYIASFKEATNQTDAVSKEQHEIASKEVNTLRVTVIKGFAKGLTVRYVGPKLKSWLIDKFKKTETIHDGDIPYGPNKEYEWIPDKKTTTNPIPNTTNPVNQIPSNVPTPKGYVNDIDLNSMIEANSGKSVDGFLSVSGGEIPAGKFDISGKEKITAIFNNVGEHGTGNSDLADLTAPTFTDKVFSSDLLNPDGKLDNSINLSTLVDSLGNKDGSLDSLENLYVSIDDRYWVRLSDLTDKLKKVTSNTINNSNPNIANVNLGTTSGTLGSISGAGGHWEKVANTVSSVTTRTVKTPNPRIVSALEKLGYIKNGVLVVDSIEDVVENVRNTHTEKENEKLLKDSSYKQERKARDYKYENDDLVNIPTSRKYYKNSLKEDKDIDENDVDR